MLHKVMIQLKEEYHCLMGSETALLDSPHPIQPCFCVLQCQGPASASLWSMDSDFFPST